MSQAGPRIVAAETRSQAVPFWTLSTFLLNGALFVLVGIEVQAAVRGLTSVDLARGLAAVAVVSAVAVASGDPFPGRDTIIFVTAGVMERRLAETIATQAGRELVD